MLSSNLEANFPAQLSATHSAITPKSNHPSTQGTQYTPCPPLSVVMFLKSNFTGTLVALFLRFVKDSHYAAL